MVEGKVSAYIDDMLIVEQPMKSFLLNFAIFVSQRLLNSNSQYYIMTSGSTSNVNWYYAWVVRVMPVGSSNQAVSPAQYNLVSQITNGVGDGKLSYGNPNVSTVALDGSGNSYFTIGCSYGNSGSTDVSVGEVGIVCYVYNDSSRPIMIARDVFDPVITVQSGKTLTILYTLKFLI